MRAIIQRVSRAQVRVSGDIIGNIGPGLCVLIAAGNDDKDADLAYIVNKVANLRIFEDDHGRMNHSVLDICGSVLAVSQFTLYGDARKGRRPTFTSAMEANGAELLYERFVDGLRMAGISNVQTGRFRAEMAVELVNDGPVTILLDSCKHF